MFILTLGEKITLLRKKKNILQKELAKYLGIKAVSLTNYETDKQRPPYETLVKIADYFDVSLDFLLREVTLQETDKHKGC